MSCNIHTIVVCTSCCRKGTDERPGHDLIRMLRKALAKASPSSATHFEVAGVACMAGCDRPCTVAYRANEKATYLFGDIDPETDMDDLVAFAHHYRDLADGWCNSGERPGKLRRTALARIPAMPGTARADKAVAS